MDPYSQTIMTLVCMGLTYIWGFHTGFKHACYQTGAFLLDIFNMKSATYLEDDIIFEDRYGNEKKASEAIWEN